MSINNVTIIGGGPAGLTAGIYCARSGLDPLIIHDKTHVSQLTQTSDVDNYPAMPNSSGYTIMSSMQSQALDHGVRMVDGIVSGIEVVLAPNLIKLVIGDDVLYTKTLIIATGATTRVLGVPSEALYTGRGVSYCAVCDGAFYNGLDVAVIGGGDTALEDALYLSRIAKSVTILYRRDQFRSSPILVDAVLGATNINVLWGSTVNDFIGDDSGLTGLSYNDSNGVNVLPVMGAFVAIGQDPNSAPFNNVLPVDDNGYIVSDGVKTKYERIFVAGDVSNPKYRQAVVAAGTGCMCAIEVERYFNSVSDE